jgi:hypothetical protein
MYVSNYVRDARRELAAGNELAYMDHRLDIFCKDDFSDVVEARR